MPETPNGIVQFEYSITLRGPKEDVGDIVRLIDATRHRASLRYLDVHFGHLVEDMTNVR
jgi:hypothetical protein